MLPRAGRAVGCRADMMMGGPACQGPRSRGQAGGCVPGAGAEPVGLWMSVGILPSCSHRDHVPLRLSGLGRRWPGPPRTGL